MILVHAVGYPGFFDRAQVPSVEGDGGGVVMDSASVEFEPLDDVQSEPKENAAGTNGSERVEATGHAVVVDGSLFLRRKTQSRRAEGSGPFGDAIQRGGREDVVLDQHGEGLGVVQDMTAQSAETGAHDAGECHAVEEVTENGESSHAMDAECGAALTGKDLTRGTIWVVIHTVTSGFEVGWFTKLRRRILTEPSPGVTAQRVDVNVLDGSTVTRMISIHASAPLGFTQVDPVGGPIAGVMF